MNAINYQNAGLIELETYGEKKIRGLLKRLLTFRRGYIMIRQRISLRNLDNHEEEF